MHTCPLPAPHGADVPASCTLRTLKSRSTEPITYRVLQEFVPRLKFQEHRDKPAPEGEEEGEV